MIKINVNTKIELKFDFSKYINLILSVMPQKHLIYLNQINFVDCYNPEIGCDEKGLGCYFFNKKDGTILINLPNVIDDKIPLYIFNHYVEIASLFLSEIIGHEVGHHVCRFWKHGIVDRENYANKYAEVCYLNYFRSRKKMILFSFFLGEINVLDFSKEDRHLFKIRRKEHSAWLLEHKVSNLYP